MSRMWGSAIPSIYSRHRPGGKGELSSGISAGHGPALSPLSGEVSSEELSCTSGIAHAPPNFLAPGTSPAAQRCRISFSELLHLRAASRTVMYSISASASIPVLFYSLYASFQVVSTIKTRPFSAQNKTFFGTWDAGATPFNKITTPEGVVILACTNDLKW